VGKLISDHDKSQRNLLQVPGGITLHDISADGRVLLTVDNERIGAMALSTAGERMGIGSRSGLVSERG